MNITFLSISLAKGGAENQLIKLAIYLKNKNHNVQIVTLGRDNDFIDLLNENGMNANFISFKYGFGYYTIINKIAKFKTDVLISFMFPSNIIARFVKFFVKVKLITSVRASQISCLYRFIYKLTYHLDDLTTFNSESALKKMIDLKITTPDKSLIINNAISIPKKNNRINNNIFTITSIAHFRDDEKDYKTFFRALKIVKLRGYKFKVYVIGRLFNKSWPIEMIEDLSLSNNINLLGFVNKPQNYLKKTNVLVLSTYGESSPNAVLEAMSYSIPVIASNVHGCDKLLLNSKGGYLSKPEDPEHLALQIIKLINMSDYERDILGANGLNYIMNNFSENSVFKSWEKIINK